jgi:hypothetical protein
MIMAIQIMILVVCVAILIIAICILSYLKLVFENGLDKNNTTDDNGIKAALDRILDILEVINNRDTKECAIEENPNSIDEPTSNKLELSPSDSVAYKDAVVAFQNINNELFALRKVGEVTHALLKLFYYGGTELSSDLLENLDDTTRERVYASLSKIKLFNESYKPYLVKGLLAYNTSWERNIRFPLNQPFDNSLDENICGEDVADGTIINRVISLGYEFPESPVIGRHKSKVI